MSWARHVMSWEVAKQSLSFSAVHAVLFWWSVFGADLLSDQVDSECAHHRICQDQEWEGLLDTQEQVLQGLSPNNEDT